MAETGAFVASSPKDALIRPVNVTQSNAFAGLAGLPHKHTPYSRLRGV